MKLLVINDNGVIGGGAENRIRLLLNEFLKRGLFKEIHILQLQSADRIICKGITVHHSPSGYMSSYRLAEQIVRDYGIDIVQAHNLRGLLPFPILATRKLDVPTVWFVHDYWVLCAFRSFINPYKARDTALCEKARFDKCVRCVGLRGALRLKLFQWIINKVDVAISPGNFVKDLYESHNVLKGKWKIVRPWIALDEFGNIKQSEIINQIIFVGPLADYKGAWVAAESLKYILKVIPDARLKFIGSCQDEGGFFRKRIEEIGIRDSTLNNMIFSGYKDWKELGREYSKGGVGVCPSIWNELFGLNWAEAMVSGCPVVASRIGSLPEFVGDRGLLVPPRDPKSLAEAIIMILKDREYAKRLADRGRRYALESFNVSRAADELIAIYNELI